MTKAVAFHAAYEDALREGNVLDGSEPEGTRSDFFQFFKVP
jgi:hypothetical protein